MKWWCSAGNGAWTWTPTAYPGVWLVMGTIAFVYWWVTRGPETPACDRWLGWLGVILLELSLDWPLGPLAAGYLATAHAVQFLIVVLTAPPLILIGARRRIAAMWPPENSSGDRALRRVFDPLLAAIVFNVVVIATHVPEVNDAMMGKQAGAFAVDLAWLLAGLWFWWFLTVPVPRRALFAVPLRMLYLFLGTLAHEGIAIVMLVHDHPMYGVYELAPRATAMSAMTDIKTAGGVMELGAAALIFGVLTVMFFRWSGGVGAEAR
ncbi:MAG TPA: cytochrome c oxidase assembly protein [Gemmatimonadaceae bacterium]|nr:cytochrome c oxidase assembly protein [Gemmatimonadaceae bacterium]